MSNKNAMIDRFNQVKALGFVKSNRSNNTGIGKTFEDYVGVVENNVDEPDLFGFEIKSHREESASYITLFTKAPDFRKGANAYLKDTFGTPYEENPRLKKIHTSIFANRLNTYEDKYSFQLINDRHAKQIRIGIHDIHTREMIDSSVGYTYESLNGILHRKLKDLFYVSAERKWVNGEEQFRFNRAEIYSEPSLNKFLQLLDEGNIMYDIRIGSYKSGHNMGKAHDHGSGFRIKATDLKLLFNNHEIIE